MADTFFIVSALHNDMAIQAGATHGSAVTLQKLDRTSDLQKWQLAMQIGGGYLGVAFVNPATGCSVTYNGDYKGLVMQPFSQGSADRDSWDMLGTGTANTMRIALPATNGLSWNDIGGGYNPGDTIGLWDDQHPNSEWTVLFG